MHVSSSSTIASIAVCAVATLATSASNAVELDALTVYAGKISDVPAWHDIITAPQDVGFVDAYVAVVAGSRELARFHNNAWVIEAEGQVAYNFGDQDHWEFNLAAIPRWRSFPWNHRIDTSVAFGLGLSWATEIPEVEVVLEGESHQLLVYWVLELTLGPPKGRWAASMRLHHRSPAFGLLGDDGGMNAPSLGMRYKF